MAVFLGVDQSYSSCAWVLTDESKQMKEFGVIKSDKTQDTFVRALNISLALSKVVTEYNVTNFHIEGLAFAMRGDATRDLAGLLFTIMAVLNLNHTDLVKQMVPPTSLKKFATGSGKADKKEMISALPEDVRLSFTDKGFKKTTGLTDLADAYWLSRYGR